MGQGGITMLAVRKRGATTRVRKKSVGLVGETIEGHLVNIGSGIEKESVNEIGSCTTGGGVETTGISHSPSRSPPAEDKAKPNFAPSGLLAAETNTVKAVDGKSSILKYNEPPEARKPVLGWRLYVFKGSEQVELLHIHRQSAYLFGRDRLVADVAVDHPSCSKQHAVIQYRYVQEKDEFGGSKGTIKPFIIDLESTNGTHVNDEAIPVSRYYELKASDVIKFGQSTREYVLLHDEAT
ncbi:SMAD/FHA domain-containing protein [Infundibulicybe gibba]|nr:SMAD/FHA domain-containing protein [Infundibulicybe gibba]